MRARSGTTSLPLCQETKARIIARSLAKSVELIENRLGKNRTTWELGKVPHVRFRDRVIRMAPNLDFIQRAGLSLLYSYFNRGPFPAPGDFTTPNISAYMIGKDFNTWMIPAMRLVVDFGLEEPFYGVNSTGPERQPFEPLL